MTRNDKPIRTFIAIPLPLNIKDTLNDLCLKLAPEKIKGISKVSKDTYHLTLKFIGDIDIGRITEIKDFLYEITLSYPPVSLKMKGFKLFPSDRRVRAVTTELEDLTEKEGSSSITRLFKEIDRTLSELNICEREKRSYVPHLTLFRIKDSKARASFLKDIELFVEAEDKYYSKFLETTFTSEDIVLYQSTLSSKGAIHTALASFKLKGENN